MSIGLTYRSSILGLKKELRAGRPGLPVRKLTTDVVLDKKPCRPRQLFRARELLVTAVDHKVEISVDTRPQNCEAGEWPARYIVHIRTSPLWDALPELAGLSLVCDCPVDQFSEAELLIGLYFDATSPGSSRTNRGTEGKWSRTVALLQGIQALPKGMSLPMISQEALVLAFCKLFPERWFQNFKLAMVEDLINSPSFCSYSAWLAERGEASDGPLVPHLAAGAVRQLARIGDGCQVGAMIHRAALPPASALQLGS